MFSLIFFVHIFYEKYSATNINIIISIIIIIKRNVYINLCSALLFIAQLHE